MTRHREPDYMDLAMANDALHAYRVEVYRLTAENERMRGALRDLQAILCDPEVTPCFAGSDGDREVARLAFAALNPEEKP